MTRTLPGRLLELLERDPGRPCIAFVDAAGGFRWRSRREFFEEARGAASALHHRGLRASDVGLIVSVDPRECATLVLATLTLGAVPLLVAPPAIQGVNSSLKDVVRDVLRRTEAALAVLPPDMELHLEELRSARPGAHLELGAEKLLAGAPGDAPLGSPSPGDVAAMQLTSGTTGFPRIAVWEHERVLVALDGMAGAMDVSESDVYLNWTPLYHDMGLVNNFLLCLAQGVPLALLSPLDVVRRPGLWLRALHDTAATTTWSPNFGFALAAERVRNEELEGVRLDRVRGFWNAAERVHLETLRRFHERFAPLGVEWKALKANFGCVETVGGVTFTDPAGPVAAELLELRALREDGVARTVPDPPEGPTGEPAQWFVGCGRPYPGLELGVFGPAGEELPDGRVGELAVRGGAGLSRFLGQPEETARTLRDGRVFTGDLGYLRDGELFWTGRLRERIVLQGRNHDPSELERALFEVEGLRKGCFCAFGVEDARRGTEVLVLLAEVEAEAAEDCARVGTRVRGRVATELGVTIEELALVPRGTLTKTSSGKRRHGHFRDLYLRGELPILWRTGAGRLS